jgi:hypothetical protein
MNCPYGKMRLSGHFCVSPNNLKPNKKIAAFIAAICLPKPIIYKKKAQSAFFL